MDFKQGSAKFITLIVILGLLVFVVVANVAFDRHIDGVSWLFLTMTGVVSTVIGHGAYKSYTRRPEDVQADFLDSRKILLLIDGSPLTHNTIRLNLQKRDFKGVLRDAEDPDQALSMLHEEPPKYEMLGLPDIIALDMKFHDGAMQGAEFIRTVRNDARLVNLPICILTRMDESEIPDDILDNVSYFVDKRDGFEKFFEAIVHMANSKKPRIASFHRKPRPYTESMLEISAKQAVFKQEDEDE